MVVGPRAYALVIGANEGGAGQQPLRFAERDARRVADALMELGRFERERVSLLAAPSRDALWSSLDVLDRTVRADTAAGYETVVVFYYSGHARAQALNLGEELVPLSDLRERILAMAGTLKIVVLDACQSGSFSRPKGAQPAADFSYNSVEQLRTAGVAVMASSSESELSQESEALGASYFTHHMLVAMRGGADANHDGQVTLAETYQYAYHRTLLATAQTAIGGQHVTLETALHGQGDVALSYPARADSHLVLEAPLAAELIVSQLPSRSVVAEVHKVAGDEMSLALPAGRYSVVVRRAGRALRCDALVTAGAATTLATQGCEVIPEVATLTKGGPTRSYETWALQVGIGVGGHRDDSFIKSLGEFGYGESGSNAGRFTLEGSYAAVPYLVLGGQLSNLGSRRYARDTQDLSQGFEWYSYGLGPFARVQPAWHKLVPYVETGAGLTVATSSFDEIVVTDPSFEPAPGSDDLPPVRRIERSQWHAGAYFRFAGGLQLMAWEHFGFFGQMAWTYAPTIGNRLDDTHDVGGVTVMIGARYRGTEAR